jgi:hypothetical protein
MPVTSRIVNVIETTNGDERTYFTLEGVMIGSFRGGARTTPEVTETPKDKPDGGIVKPLTPHQVQRAKDKEAESLQTPEAKLKHLKEDIA